MSYSRCCNPHQVKNFRGQRRIRTSVLVREQIYSLSPLATRPSAHRKYELQYSDILSHLPESNWRPTDYKSVALPAELRWRITVSTNAGHSCGNGNKELPLILRGGKGKGI